MIREVLYKKFVYLLENNELFKFIIWVALSIVLTLSMTYPEYILTVLRWENGLIKNGLITSSGAYFGVYYFFEIKTYIKLLNKKLVEKAPKVELETEEIKQDTAEKIAEVILQEGPRIDKLKEHESMRKINKLLKKFDELGLFYRGDRNQRVLSEDIDFDELTKKINNLLE